VPLLPDTPTVNESGVPGYKVTTWSGLLAPAGVPADVVTRLTAAWAKVMASPAVQKELTERGLVPSALAPAAFAQFLKEDKDEWARLVREARVEPE
jgi:tripartite-type tricarboxylate transporter receptor subunit TctC